MKVGVKYCGGCNPRYDRRGAVMELQERLALGEMDNVKGNGVYHTVLLVCGCPVCCINEYREAEAVQYITLESRADFTNPELSEKILSAAKISDC